MKPRKWTITCYSLIQQFHFHFICYVVVSTTGNSCTELDSVWCSETVVCPKGKETGAEIQDAEVKSKMGINRGHLKI